MKTYTVAIDDNILVEGLPLTAGSKMLSGFVPLFDAEVVSRLRKAKFDIKGKAKIGEFGLNPLDESEAASRVKDGAVDYALCLDVNGAPRRAAALSNIVFIKPSYGTVSRHGTIPCACSAEQVGVMAKDVRGAADVLKTISGHDEKDGTSLVETPDYVIGDAARLRVFAADDPQADGAAAALERAGAHLERGAVEMLGAMRAAWQILLCAETCNNLSRYDGVKYGHRAAVYSDIESLYTASRSEGFGAYTKAAILYGSDVLSKDRYQVCYDKALRIRRAAHEMLTRLLTDFDVLLLPASAPERSGDELTDAYHQTLYTAPASLTGFPSVSAGGAQCISRAMNESAALTAAAVLEGGIA